MTPQQYKAPYYCTWNHFFTFLPFIEHIIPILLHKYGLWSKWIQHWPIYIITALKLLPNFHVYSWFPSPCWEPLCLSDPSSLSCLSPNFIWGSSLEQTFLSLSQSMLAPTTCYTKPFQLHSPHWCPSPHSQDMTDINAWLAFLFLLINLSNF